MDKNQQLKDLNQRIMAKFKPKPLLFGKGGLNSQVMIVSEYPDFKDLKQDKHLAYGENAKIFNQLLKSLNLSRRNVYITSAIKAVKGKDEIPSPKEIKQFSQFLREEIKIIEPKLIIALGSIALRGLNVKLPLLNLRGRLIRFGANSLFATHHPLAVIQDTSLRPELEKDSVQLSGVIKSLSA